MYVCMQCRDVISLLERKSTSCNPPIEADVSGTPAPVSCVPGCHCRVGACRAVPGLYLLPDFVTEDAEAELLTEIKQRPFDHLNRRSVQHYGTVRAFCIAMELASVAA